LSRVIAATGDDNPAPWACARYPPVLREHGIAAAAASIVEAEGRTFLQSTRSDRTSALGRHCVPPTTCCRCVTRPAASGEAVSREYELTPPRPETFEAWREAARIADSFRERVARANEISFGFRAIAAQAGEILAKARARFG
jgi:hypothetical protein